jgi:hypothetical protein
MRREKCLNEPQRIDTQSRKIKRDFEDCMERRNLGAFQMFENVVGSVRHMRSCPQRTPWLSKRFAQVRSAVARAHARKAVRKAMDDCFTYLQRLDAIVLNTIADKASA